MPLHEVLDDVKSGHVLLDTPAVAALSPGARALLRALLAREPAERVSARDALAHPWLASAHAGAGVA
jgi:hypothetical protein